MRSPFSDTPPEVLYLYLAAPSEEHDTTNILSARQIKTSRVGNLNDPFDLAPAVAGKVSPADIKKYLEERGHLAGDKGRPTPPNIAKLKERLDRIAKDPLPEWVKANAGRRLLCFSSRRDGPLLWSHYASRHAGFVVGFNTQALFQAEPMSVFFEVKYSTDRPQIRVLDFLGDRAELSFNVFGRKSIQWQYEKEWRALHFANDLRDSDYLPFTSEAVSEIVLGSLISMESEHLIREACTKGGIASDDHLYRAKLNHERFEIDVDAGKWGR
jgi:Protein of unknown function (DUF2971)